jgi:hypothetical protein
MQAALAVRFFQTDAGSIRAAGVNRHLDQLLQDHFVILSEPLHKAIQSSLFSLRWTFLRSALGELTRLKKILDLETPFAFVGGSNHLAFHCVWMQLRGKRDFQPKSWLGKERRGNWGPVYTGGSPKKRYFSLQLERL